MQMKGIDVSRFQGDIDFNQVKNSGIDFVVIRAGVGDGEDTMFEENYRKTKEAGLHIGFYWFCYGETISEISHEADLFIDALKDKQFDFPAYMDLEYEGQYNQGKTFCSNAVREFCGKLERAGYFTGLYASTSWLETVIEDDIREKYTIWVADWRGYCGYSGDYGMWQYGAGYVPGINGMTDLSIIDIGYDTDYPGSVVQDGVDLDYAYVDFPSIIVPDGLNNNPKPVEDNSCKEVANTLDINGYVPKLAGDSWFLIDENCEFTLETLPYAKVRIYLVGGGQNGAEWYDISQNGVIGYDISDMGRGGAVFVKELTIEGNVSCKAWIAGESNFKGTGLQIGNEVYTCGDEGCVWRAATSSGGTNKSGNNVNNAESGANGVATPYGYVGSSGGGGGGYSLINGNKIAVYAGKGGIGAGDGGELKQNGQDAVNYGCGGGAAGFGGFPNESGVVETHCGRGMQGCIIFEILDGGTCGETDSDHCCCNNRHEFQCPDGSNTDTYCETEENTTIRYIGGEANETKTERNVPCATVDINGNPAVTSSTPYANNSNANTATSSNCGCSSRKGSDNSSANRSTNSSGKSCGCSSNGGSNNGKCVSYDVQKWGENWLLFDKTGEYLLDASEDLTLDVYVVGGGSDGKNGVYFNKTAYGGEGGNGGCVCVYTDVPISKGNVDITVNIGGRGVDKGTSVIINNNEYSCNGAGHTQCIGGNKGIAGAYGFQHAGNGENGIETPFGYLGSSGGGGGAYRNSQNASRGYGGLNAGDGGKIANSTTSAGGNAVDYGCGGGGGSAMPNAYCSGGKGKQGCVILKWE